MNIKKTRKPLNKELLKTRLTMLAMSAFMGLVCIQAYRNIANLFTPKQEHTNEDTESFRTIDNVSVIELSRYFNCDEIDLIQEKIKPYLDGLDYNKIYITNTISSSMNVYYYEHDIYVSSEEFLELDKLGSISMEEYVRVLKK